MGHTSAKMLDAVYDQFAPAQDDLAPAQALSFSPRVEGATRITDAKKTGVDVPAYFRQD